MRGKQKTYSLLSYNLFRELQVSNVVQIPNDVEFVLSESCQQACNAIGMIGMNHPNDGRNYPKDPCHWDEIIPMDGGWLPHWDEALDESTGIIEAVYFAI